VQLAILGSSEAEKKGLSQEMGQAFMALAEAHRDQGDLENAIGASTRASMVSGNLHSKQRVPTPCCSWPICTSAAGHPQKALEHLEEARQTARPHPKMDRAKFIRMQTKAKSHGAGRPAALVGYCQRRAARGGNAAKRPTSPDAWTCFQHLGHRAGQRQA
jgi:hypothetical protein